jgi:uncharacterized protein (DUF1697 family)
MTTFVALLRGINVGRAKRIAMADLRALLEGLGYTDVVTLLNSGNAVFRATKGTPAQHALEIRKAIAAQLQLDVPVLVATDQALDAVAADNPFTDAPDASRLLVAFAQDAQALLGLNAIGNLVVAPEAFAVGRHAAYLHCAGGILDSKAGKALLGKVGNAVTTRNWATVLKLRALVF